MSRNERRDFEFTVRVKVVNPDGDAYGTTPEEMKRAARSNLVYQLDRDGQWLSVGSAGMVTVTNISRGKLLARPPSESRGRP